MNTRWGGKSRTDSEGKVPQAWDHDPPAKEKLVPFGILIMLTGALTLIFGHHETSDFWGDCLRAWWTSVKDQFPNVRRLTIYLDNGPKNSGTRTQFLKRMIEFADWSGLEIHLVYYPPYHSKYNRIERCWSSLQQKWNGVLLTCWNVVKACAQRMTWKGQHPAVMQLDGDYPIGVIVPKKEMKELNKRLDRLASARSIRRVVWIEVLWKAMYRTSLLPPEIEGDCLLCVGTDLANAGRRRLRGLTMVERCVPEFNCLSPSPNAVKDFGM